MTPKHLHLDRLDAALITPQTQSIVRFKATIPVYGSEDRMLAPLYAELLSRGTKHKTRKQFAAALERLGAQLSAASDRYGVTIEGCALAETFPAFLRLVEEMLRVPAFSPSEIAQTHKHYLQALEDEKDDARAGAYDMFTRILYPKEHPYHRPTAETRRAFLTSAARKKYLDFHARLFDARMTVSVAGGTDTQQNMLRLFSSLASRTAPARSDPSDTARMGATAEKETVVRQTVEGKPNIELYIGNMLPLTLADREYLAFQFGLAVLGKWGGFSGRLMSRVREKEGLTYRIYARTEGATKTRSGMWYIATFFTPRDLEKGLASTKREIAQIVEKGVTEREITRFKELLKNQFILAHESDAGTLSLYHDALAAGMTPAELAAEHEKIQRLTRTEINAALRAHLSPSRLIISGAGPIASKKI